MIVLKCRQHSLYNGLAAPPSDCTTCWDIWHLLDRLVYKDEIELCVPELYEPNNPEPHRHRDPGTLQSRNEKTVLQ